ncbi:MAG: hypothetical protein QW303_00245 [Nitrososphaerota archaeon]
MLVEFMRIISTKEKIEILLYYNDICRYKYLSSSRILVITMPRPKEDSKKKNKKIKEKDGDEVVEEDESVKSVKTPKKEDEDELSDLELVEEDSNQIEEGPLESQKNQPTKVIDPKTPIGDLKTDDILTYLIQIGKDTLNPQLKFGAYDLLMQLTGRRRRYPPPPRRQFLRGGRGWHRGQRIPYRKAQEALSKAKNSDQTADSKDSNLYGEK